MNEPECEQQWRDHFRGILDKKLEESERARAELQADRDKWARGNDEWADEATRRQGTVFTLEMRIGEALSLLYGCDYEEGSRIGRAIEALEGKS